MDFSAVLLALLTLAAGLGAGWALASNRAANNTARGSNTAALVGLERDAAIAERDRLIAERAADRETARQDVEAVRHAARAEVEAERHHARLESEKVMTDLRASEVRASEAATKLAALEQSDEQLRDTFARMSSEALAKSSTQFLELADERFKKAGAPLTDTLGKVELQLKEIEKERVGAQASLREQIDSVLKTGDALRQETATLVGALRKPQARGRWGELQLRRCVDLAGMTDRCDFFEQETVSTSDGSLRPDLVVKLVGGKSIVVDSKVTLSAYLEAYEATDEAIRAERLAAHAKHLRQHVNELAAKSYWAQFSPAPEFVVLFVPGDSFLAAALDSDPAVLDDAFDKRIHIATPTTLISVLRAVAYAWQQESLAENAQQVFELGSELYSRLSVFGGRMDAIGKGLTRSVKAYNDAVGSLERKVFVQARRLNELNVVTTLLEAPEPVEESVRALSAPELIDSADQARPLVALPVTEAAEAVDGLFDRANDYGIEIAASPGDDQRRTGS